MPYEKATMKEAPDTTMIEALRHIMIAKAWDVKTALRDMLRTVEDGFVQTWREFGEGYAFNSVAFCEDARFRLGERGASLLKALKVACETDEPDQGPSIFVRDFDFVKDIDDVIPQATSDPDKSVEEFEDLTIIDYKTVLVSRKQVLKHWPDVEPQSPPLSTPLKNQGQKRTSPRAFRIREAIKAAFPNGIPEGITAKARDGRIRDSLKLIDPSYKPRDPTLVRAIQRVLAELRIRP